MAALGDYDLEDELGRGGMGRVFRARHRPTGAKLARVLERCAAAGLVHRDVKPENVLVDEAGEPALSDFGCVRDLEAASLTESGGTLGTPAYMSPEQLNGARVGPPSDVYSL